MSTINAIVLRRTVNTVSLLTSGALALSNGQWGLAKDDDTLVCRDLAGAFHYFYGAAAILDEINDIIANTDHNTLQGRSDSNCHPMSSITGLLNKLSYLNPEWIDFIPQSAVPAFLEGRFFYDDAKHTFSFYNDITNTSQQIGLETWQRVRNRSGATITDGSVVYIDGATGQLATIQKAISTAQAPSAILGMVTADIADQAEGWVTLIGEVNDIDTSFLTEGSPVYLSDSVAGEYTSTKPYNAIQIGICLYTHATHGKISITINDANDYLRLDTCNDTKDPTGFVNPENITVTYNGTTRKVTLATTDDQLYYYFNGVRKKLGTNTWTSDAHTASAGKWFLYSTDGDTFTWSNTVWIYSYVQVAYIKYVSSTKYISIRECHGIMPWNAHKTAHLGIGTQRDSSTPTGGTINGYTLSSTATADRRPGASAVNLLDEDLINFGIGLTDGGPYSHLYLTSSIATDFDISGLSEIVRMSGTTPQYQNPSTAAWNNISATRFANVYLIAVPTTFDSIGLSCSWLWFQPQAEYANLDSAKAEEFASLNKADLLTEFAEFLPVAKVTIKCSAVSYFSIEAIEQLYGSRISAAGIQAPAATTASAVAYTPTGGVSSSNVQDAITELDTEKANLSGAAFTGQVSAVSSSFPVIQGARTTSITDGVVGVYAIDARSSGDMVDGFGSGLICRIRDVAGTDNTIAAIFGIRNGADNTGKLRLTAYTLGTAYDVVEISKDLVKATGFLSATLGGSLGHNKTTVSTGSSNNEINSYAEWQEFRFTADATYSIKSFKTPPVDGAMIIASLTVATSGPSAVLQFNFAGTPSAGYSKLLWGKNFASTSGWSITSGDTYPRSGTFRYSSSDDAWILVSVGGA